MTITWILVAHGSAAKILEVKKNGQEIVMHKDFFHPQTAKKEPLPGSKSQDERVLPHLWDYSKDNGGHERQVFAKEIVDFLTKAHATNQFTALILVASRDLLGDLRKAMHNPLSASVTHELNKDLLSQNLSNNELVEKIRTDLDLIQF